MGERGEERGKKRVWKKGVFSENERKKEGKDEKQLRYLSPGPRLRCPGCVSDVVDDDGSSSSRRSGRLRGGRGRGS